MGLQGSDRCQREGATSTYGGGDAAVEGASVSVDPQLLPGSGATLPHGAEAWCSEGWLQTTASPPGLMSQSQLLLPLMLHRAAQSSSLSLRYWTSSGAVSLPCVFVFCVVFVCVCVRCVVYVCGICGMCIYVCLWYV